MKKVLILAYDFPPYVSVGGLRPFSWYKYLSQFGYFPVVITRQWSNRHRSHLDYVAPGESEETIIENAKSGQIFRMPYKPNLANRLLLKYGEQKFVLLRKLFTLYDELLQHFSFLGTKSFIYRGAETYLKENKVDLIIATGAPHILFKYASKLSKTFNIPWVADYRDPWSQSRSRNAFFLFKILNPYFEKKYLRNASLITTVSLLFKEKISSLIQSKPIKIITNGFDSELTQYVQHIKQNEDYLTIAHVGTVYFYHPFNSFFEGIQTFKEKYPNSKLKVKFYGLNLSDAGVKNIISNFDDNHFLEFVPKLPNEKLLEEIAKDNLFLLFNNFSKIGTKIYDYIALKRLILFCYTGEYPKEAENYPYFTLKKNEVFAPQSELIRETNAGILIKNQSDLVRTLEKLYLEFEKNGQIECHSQEIQQYSRRAQAQKLAGVFDELLKSKLASSL